MKTVFLTALTLTLLCQLSPTLNRTARTTHGGITGHYAFSSNGAENTLDVELLPGGRVKFALYASWIGSDGRVTGNINIGEIQGIAPLRNNTVVYEQGECRITMRFMRRRIRVTQQGSSIPCDFGLNVPAEGTYRKVNSRRPRFDF